MSRLATDIWTPLLFSNFQSYSRGTKESRRKTVQKSLSIMLCSHSLTWRQWGGGRRSSDTDEPVWPVLEEGGVSGTELTYPPNPIREEDPAGHQRLQQGQIVEELVWNNSCLINQRMDVKQQDYNDPEKWGSRVTVSMHSQCSPSSSSSAAVTMTMMMKLRKCRRLWWGVDIALQCDN